MIAIFYEQFKTNIQLIFGQFQAVLHNLLPSCIVEEGHTSEVTFKSCLKNL